MSPCLGVAAVSDEGSAPQAINLAHSPNFRIQKLVQVEVGVCGVDARVVCKLRALIRRCWAAEVKNWIKKINSGHTRKFSSLEAAALDMRAGAAHY
jgi:hypothetical protein